MRSFRPLRLEALEDRTAPALLGVGDDVLTANSSTLLSAALTSTAPAPTPPTDTTITLVAAPTTPPPPPPDGSFGLQDPIGTPINP